jgi:hypothetical protein
MLSHLFRKNRLVEETSFSKFFRTASSAEKKRAYAHVLERATARQVKVIEEAGQAERQSSTTATTN